MSVAQRRDGSIVVADMLNSTLSIFAPTTGVLVNQFSHSLILMPKGCVEIHTGEMVASSHMTGQLLLWRRDDSVVALPPLPIANARPACLAVSPCGKIVYAGDETLRKVWSIHNVGTDQPIRSEVLMSDIATEGITVLDNGTLLVSDTLARVVHHLTTNGEPIARYGAGAGTAEGEFDYPVGSTALPYSRFAVCDRRNSRLQIMTHSLRTAAAGTASIA